MLRVRAALTGWEGGPGLLTAYFLTPLQNDAAASRCVTYVRTVLIAARTTLYPTAVIAQTSGDVDVLDSATGQIIDTLSVNGEEPQGGGGGASKAPTAVAGLCQLKTDTFIAGRRVRGRQFVSPLAASVVTSDGVLSNGAQAILAGTHTAMVAALASGDTWVVWHRPKLGVGGLATPVVATSAPFKLAVLTSRRD